MEKTQSYFELNNSITLRDPKTGFFQFERDKEAIKAYLDHVNANMITFGSIEERYEFLTQPQTESAVMCDYEKVGKMAHDLGIDFMDPMSVAVLESEVEERREELFSLRETTTTYLEKELIDQYTMDEIVLLHNYANSFGFKYKSFMQAFKFFNDYALKTNDQKKWLENFEEHQVLTAMLLGKGNIYSAIDHLESLMHQINQPATPTYLNAGRSRRGEYVSCFLLALADTTESIQYNLTAMAHLSRICGGVSFEVSNLRIMNDPIKNIDNASKQGPLGVLLMAERVFAFYNQLGQREGSGAGYISIFNGDADRILESKKPHADASVKLKSLSIGLTVWQKFYDLVDEDKDFHTFSPYDVNKYYGMKFTDVDFDEMYDTFVADPRMRKISTHNAREYLIKTCQLMFQSGYPYIFNITQANKHHALRDVGKILLSNLCVTGDTRLLTNRGYVKAKDLYDSGMEINVAIDNRTKLMQPDNIGTTVVSAIPVMMTASQAKVYEIQTLMGQAIKATEWHKFYVRRNGAIIKIQLNQILEGDELLIQSGEGIYGPDDNVEAIRYEMRRGVVKEDVPEVVFWSNKATQVEYLRQVFNSKGGVLGDTIGIQSESKKFLQDIQMFLLNMGILTQITNTEDGKVVALYSLTIPSDNRVELTKFYNTIGFNTVQTSSLIYDVLAVDDYSKYTHADHLLFGYMKYATPITSIEMVGYEDVYDTTQEDYHSLIFNGLVTGNCTEIAQIQEVSDIRPYYEEDTIKNDVSCILASNNITNLMEYAKKHKGGFRQMVHITMDGLTVVSDLTNIREVPGIAKANSEMHAVGMGDMDLQGFLAKNHISYESFEARDFVRTYYAMKNFYSLEFSVMTAKKTGIKFHGFEKSDYATGKYFNKYLKNDYSPKTDKIKDIFDGIEIPTIEDWERLKMDAMTYGVYHAYRMAIAPTQSISYVQNATGYIGPIIDVIEARATGKYIIQYPAPHYDASNMWYYKTAYNVNMYRLIDLVAEAQKHVDQAISTILYVTNKTTTAELASLIIYANRKNLKTLYYVRTNRTDDNSPNVCVSCSV